MACEIHKNDIGTVFEITVKECDIDGNEVVVDISSVTTKKICFLKPNKSVLTVDAVFKTDGSDGILKYVTVADDLNVAGSWQKQAFLVFPATGSWRSTLVDFTVVDNICL
jgi:hypothetical protein